MPGTNLASVKAPHEQVSKNGPCLVMAILVILTAAYAFAPHPPAMPEQVLDATELETYLNRLVDSGNPPGLVVDRVRFGNYALRYLLYQHK